ncbi:allantoinase [Paenibacillus sp. DS2015]|uniref:allantoinase n=1 Tax=Paenibacillus sp. DS2015 TaxID=3373917 RepID=UPI003D205407
MPKKRYDLVIQGGSVVLKESVAKVDIGISQGVIIAIEPALPIEEAELVYDATGLHVLPGMVDIHVHFNEPGLGQWEGFATGSAALAAGGCTTYVDMPLNGIPPTIHVSALEQKMSLAENTSYVDYGLWGGLVPGNLNQLSALASRGVVGFKAFMSDPGGEGADIFARADDMTLLEGMQEIASFGGILALHAESDEMITELSARKRFNNQTSSRDFAESRPVIAEVEAVSRALVFARETGCSLHFVHISSRKAVDLIHEAKLQGMNVTAETCPHYLCLTDKAMETIGAVAKCAPPLRSQSEQDAMWSAVQEGGIDVIASDHSPCPPSMKWSSDFFEIWGGISGAQSSVLLMLEEGHVKRGISLPQISNLLSYQPAARVGLDHRKGEISVGMDADLAIVNMNRGFVLTEEDLLYRHKQSPYIGRSFSCSIAATFCRGHLVYDLENGVSGTSVGTFVPRMIGGES